MSSGKVPLVASYSEIALIFGCMDQIFYGASGVFPEKGLSSLDKQDAGALSVKTADQANRSFIGEIGMITAEDTVLT